MDDMQFKALLLSISRDLRDDNLVGIKFQITDLIGKRSLEKIQSGHEVFDLLMERGLLAADNLDFLFDLLKNINRPDLAKSLTGGLHPGEAICPALDQREEAKLKAAEELVVENVGRDWRKLGRKLGLPEVKLDSIAQRFPTDLEETTMELLKEWRKKRGAELRIEELIQALRLCRLNLTADKVEDKLKELEEAEPGC